MKEIIDSKDVGSLKDILGDFLNYPTGWDEHYRVCRQYIMEQLQKLYPERNLLNFHFTPGDKFMQYTKEEMWEHMKAIEEAPTVEGPPVSSKKSKVSIREFIKDV